MMICAICASIFFVCLLFKQWRSVFLCLALDNDQKKIDYPVVWMGAKMHLGGCRT